MSERRRWGRLARGAAAAGIAALSVAPALLAAPAGAAPPAHVSASRSSKADAVQLKVVDLNPVTPPASSTSRPLTVTLSLTNTTGATLRSVEVVGVRGDPLQSQSQLDGALDDRTPPSDRATIESTPAATITLPADGTAHLLTFRTTVGIPTSSGICQCASGVYPLYFVARTAGAAATARRLGTAVTFLPSFLDQPDPVRVSWVWPLIDRPHRLAAGDEFTDDDLAASVGGGGRLDRALAVAEQVAGRVPLTLVVDPELLDELEVMAAGKYTVTPPSSGPAPPTASASASPRPSGSSSGARASSSSDSAAPVAGSGQGVAVAWLARLATLLQSRPDVRVQLTPYADPEVQSLALQGLSWRTTMPATMTARVTTALAGRPLDYSLAWPAGGALTTKTLGTLVARGLRSVLLPATAVRPRDGANGAAAQGSARLVRDGHTVAAALTSAAVQADVSAVVTSGAAGAAQLPQLLAEIAIRAAQQPAAQHTLVITPPRYVDPDVAATRRAILATSSSPFARPISLAGALDSTRLPATRSTLAPFPSSTPTLPAQVVRSASDVTGALPVVDSLLAGSGAEARTLTNSLPVALQRTQSSYWMLHAATGAQFAARLVDQVNAIVDGVAIVQPSSGAYTLGSSSSPLPITVRNDLPYPVRVRVRVSTVNGLPGFSVHDIGMQVVEAQARRTLHLPTSILRSGRIQIEAQLLTPRRQALGGPVSLSVHSTALGVIGVVITAVAGAILVLALVVRALRRLHRRRLKGRTA